MISHQHRCIFIHVPKTAGKSILTLFGLPELGTSYRGQLVHIEDPYDHVPVTRYVSRPYFSGYFKFAFVRNPWDRVVSAFHYLEAGGSNVLDRKFKEEWLSPYAGNFSKFVEDLPRFLKTRHFMPQWRFLCDEDGQQLVDFVGRFEALSEGVRHVAQRCGLPEQPVPHVNASKHEHYVEYYDSASRGRVAEVYARDLRLFDYTYPSG